ncbi:MAG: ABC transporter permease [Elusimicrobia bacterium]|nr:ABC transporter permease [Elusimicrobiota bacterium]
MSFELFVALRYMKTRRKGLFTVITTVIGVAGVATGVAALICVLSVMNGFQADIQRKIIGAQAHLNIYGNLDARQLERLAKTVGARKEVSAFAPFAVGQAIVTYHGRTLGVVLKGIDPGRSFRVNALASSLTTGSWAEVGPGKKKAKPGCPKGLSGDCVAGWGPPAILGEELAKNLGVWLGEEVVFISPQEVGTSFGLVPKMKKFRVVGLLRTGYYEYDSATAYAGLADVSDFLGVKSGASGIEVRLKDMDDADRVAQQLQRELGFDYSVRSFHQLNRTLFAALKLEKYVMFLIVTLITLVAAFNIGSNLILLGTEKLRDIGLLMAMGAKPSSIRRIFLWEGLLIGGFGVVAGTALGLLLCWVIWRYPIVELPPDIYYLSRVPVQVELSDLAAIVGSGLVMSLIATLYPALKASRVNPVEAIHYG